MRRIENWPEKLFALVEARANAPFEWGVHDCCIFSADVIAGITGIDIAAGLRGLVTPLSAMRALRARGGLETVAAGACLAAGFEECHVALLAQRGDLVLHDTPRHGPALGVCVGSNAIFAALRGTAQIPLTECRRAWATV